MDKRDQILRGTKGTADGRRVLFVFLVALVAIGLVLLAACGPATPMVIEREVPVQIEQQVVETVVVEGERPVIETAVVETVKAIADDVPQEPPFPIPIILVPEVAIERMDQIAQGLAEEGLVVGPVPFFNASRATSYALPSPGQSAEGLLLMAAPVTESQEAELAELSELPGLALGGFHLPQGIEGYALPPGQYVARVFFRDGQPHAELYDENFQVVSDVPMVVRRLQHREVTEPEVAITAWELCFTQTTLQACIQLPPPLSLQVADRMKRAVDELSEAGLLEVDIDTDGTVPDIEGVEARSICAETVGEEPGRCQPSVLAAPAFEFRTEPVAGESIITQKATAGVLVVLEEIHDEVWSAETGELATLPPGNYVVDFLETFDGRWLALLTPPGVKTPGAAVEELSSPDDFSDDAVFINFDELPNGSHVTDQYVNEGVVFLDVQETSHRITQAPPSFSPPNQLYHYRGPDDENRKLPLTMVFQEPQARVGFYFSNAKAAVATLTAYDASGQVIHRLTRTPPEDEWQFWGVFSRAGNIARVTLDYGDDFRAEAIDDLYFESNGAAVEELSSPDDFSDDAVFINFDELPNGSHVTDQYVNEGVVFLDVQETSHRITQAPPGFSPPNVVYHYRGPDDENRKLPLTMVFGEPQAKVGFYFLPAANATATLAAYDATGQVIHQLTQMTAVREWQFWGIFSRAGNIARVTLDYGDSFTAEGIDDLYFESNAGPSQFLMIAESQLRRTEVLGEPIQGEPPPVPEDQGQVVIKNMNWRWGVSFCLFRWLECP